MPEDGPISRIVYVCLGAGDTAGGAKMIFRHVEALRELGRDAAVLLSRAEHAPAWFDHAAPVLVGPGALRPDDLVVVPEDAPAVVRMLLTAGLTPTLFCQNHHYFKAGVGALSAEVLARLDRFLAPSRTVADWLTARFPRAEVAVVPAFVDERLFRPRPKVVSVAYIPRKRRDEAQLIR